jgi:hypothetical protein
LARENLRATQIMQEKMETIRLYRWDQINSPGFIPEEFNEPFYAGNEENPRLLYSGKVAIDPVPMTESYKDDLRMISIEIAWQSGNHLRQRRMKTFVSRYGLQNYIY